jgi:hypothetical protein
LGCYDLLDYPVNWNDLLNYALHFSDAFGYNGHLPNNFLIFHAVEYLLLYSFDLAHLDDLFLNGYNLLHNLWDLHWFFDGLGDGDDPFDDLLHGNWDLHGDDDLLLDLDDLWVFDYEVHYFLYFDVVGDLLDDLDDLLNDDAVVDDFLFVLGYFYQLIDNLLYYFLDFDVDVFGDIYFHHFLLDEGHLHNSLDLLNPLLYDDFGYNFLYNLRYFNNFFDDSGYNYNFLDYFLNFNNFGYFYHFFNYFFNWYFYLFDTVNCFLYLYQFLLDVLNGSGNVDEVVYYLLYFDGLGLLDDDGVAKVDLLDDGVLDALDHWFFDELLDNHYLFVDDWDFNDLLYFFRDLPDNFDWYFDFLDNLFYGLLDHYLLLDPHNLFDLLHDFFNDHYLLDHLWYFNHSFDHLDDGDGFFDYAVHYLVADFDVVVDLFGGYHLDLWHYFLHYLLDLYNFGHLNDFLYYLLYDNGDLLYNLDCLFRGYDFLHHDLNRLYFGFYVIDDLLGFHYSLNFDLFLLDTVDYLHLWDFLDDLHYFLDNLWYLHNLLDGAFNGHQFLYCISDNCRDLQWDIDNSLHLYYFLNFYNPLDNLLHGHNLWDLHNPIDYFLDYLLHLDYFGYHFEHLQDIVNIDQPHDFLVNHADYALVNLKHHIGLSLHLLELLKQCLD